MSKTQLSKIIQSRGFLGRLLGPLLRTGLPLMKSVIQPLVKSVLIPLGLTLKIVKSLEDLGLLLEGVSDKSQVRRKSIRKYISKQRSYYSKRSNC